MRGTGPYVALVIIASLLVIIMAVGFIILIMVLAEVRRDGRTTAHSIDQIAAHFRVTLHAGPRPPYIPTLGGSPPPRARPVPDGRR